MTQPDHPGRRAPRRRSDPRADTTHPVRRRPGERRGGDRRPWPTAPGTTRVSPAKPTSGTARSRSRASTPTPTPTPATVWPAGPSPIDLDATWPAALVSKIVASFSEPGAQVVLLAWPSPHPRPPLATVGPDGAINHVHDGVTGDGVGAEVDPAPGSEPDPELADALNAINDLDRAGRVDRVPPGPAPEPIGAAPAATVDRSARESSRALSEPADLIITSLHSEHADDHSTGLAALYSARLLRVGGILVVLTHCDWAEGELTDPTGAVVTAGQNADLLYLQHIVALHEPVRDGCFLSTDERPDSNPEHGAAGRARHRARVRGLPVPHRRIHSDVLVFAQPHDHQPPPPPAAPARGGDRAER